MRAVVRLMGPRSVGPWELRAAPPRVPLIAIRTSSAMNSPSKTLGIASFSLGTLCKGLFTSSHSPIGLYGSK
jgi:hypothetical protein